MIFFRQQSKTTLNGQKKFNLHPRSVKAELKSPFQSGKIRRMNLQLLPCAVRLNSFHLLKGAIRQEKVEIYDTLR